MAVITRRATFPGKTAIVAGNKEKASIIMGYAISHIFDNEFTRKRFVMESGESEESIRRYKNKSRINFDLGDGTLGEIFITTGAGALGFGADDVIEDESPLISDQDHAMVMRMLGDSADSFLCKIGNAFESEHFRKSFEDPDYKKLIIDYRQGLQEGRITPEKVEEARKHPFFGELYECKFPPLGKADERNWVPLITRDEIKIRLVPFGYPVFGFTKIGNDVAGGGKNFTVMLERRENVAKILVRNQDPDTMNLAEKIINRTWDPVRRKDIIPRGNVSIDKVGIGKGVYDIVNKNIPGVIGVNAGEKLDPKITKDPHDNEYFNLRAKMFWKAREWLLGGGKLELMEDENENESVWYELSKIKYRTKLEGTTGKIQIMPKELMLKEGIESPDVADTLSLTFAGLDIPQMDEEEEEMMRDKEDRSINPFDPFSSEF